MHDVRKQPGTSEMPHDASGSPSMCLHSGFCYLPQANSPGHARSPRTSSRRCAQWGWWRHPPWSPARPRSRGRSRRAPCSTPAGPPLHTSRQKEVRWGVNKQGQWGNHQVYVIVYYKDVLYYLFDHCLWHSFVNETLNWRNGNGL